MARTKSHRKGTSDVAGRSDLLGAFFTVAHLPSTVAPAGLSKSGLPVGVQIVGPEYGDLMCIEVARQLEQGFQGFVAPKGWA